MKSIYKLFLPFALILSVQGFAQGITFINCGEIPVCLPFNNCTQASATSIIEASTTCFNQNLTFSYKVDFGNNGSFEVQETGNTVTQNFPVGISRINWRATSSCGHIATCDQIVNVKDCTGPNLICRNGITQSLDANCSMTVNAQQFVLSISDNCTPANQIQYGLRRIGTGTGFPTKDTIQYATCDQGTNIVEMWVRDAAGNINQCANYVLVQDNSNNCPCISSTDIKIKGCMRSATNTKLNTYRVNAKAQGTTTGGAPVNATKFSSFQDSCYTLDFNGLPVNFTGNVAVSASRVDLVTNGITPYDLVLISRHILNLEPMTNIYQVLAADVNRSHTVTTFDIVEIRKTLLGTVDTLPAVGAWQFIRPVADPLQMLNFAAVKDTFLIPFSNASGASTVSNFNFIGIKSADMDYTASLMGAVEDRHGSPLLLTTEDKWIEAGQSFKIPVSITEASRLSAWQLNLRPVSAAFTSVEGLSEDAFAIQPDGSLRILWMDENLGAARSFSAGQTLVYIVLTAQTSGWLSQMIETDSQPAEAITDAVMIRPIYFHFSQNINSLGTQVFQPSPNPTHNWVQWPVLLENKQPLRLQMVDASGKLVLEQHTTFDAGVHQWSADCSALSPGWYGWRITAGTVVQSGKILKQ